MTPRFVPRGWHDEVTPGRGSSEFVRLCEGPTVPGSFRKRALQMLKWSYRKNARHRNPKKDVRKAVCNKTKRKTKNEMVGRRVHGPEKDGCKRMERQSKESRGLKAHCRGGQGPPRAVAPSGVDWRC